MARREELTNEQWALINPLLPVPRRADGRGRPWRDGREVLNGILWILRDDTLLRATASHFALRRHQITTGELSSRLARVLDLARNLLHAMRHCLQPNLNAAAPTAMRAATACEADGMAAARSTATLVKG
jgi:transposase